MYVSKIAISNWRNFTTVEMNLREITYILGPNASGKSNLLDVFRFMRDLVKPQGGGLQQSIESRGGLTKVRCLAARRDPSVTLDIELRDSLNAITGNANWRYILSIRTEAGGKRRPLVAREEVFKDGDRILLRPGDDDRNDKERLTQTHLEQINMNQVFRPIAEYFQEVLYLHLVPQLLRYGSQVAMPALESDPFGQKFLDEIAGAPNKTRVSRLRRVEEILQKVVPNFKQLEFVQDKVSGKPHLEMLYSHWRPNAGKQREDQFSDGTLRLIALTWTLLATNSMILLEEPELSLHESVVKQIPTLVYKARQSRKVAGGQLLISTHSGAMLSSEGISGSFLMLKPGHGGESTNVFEPSEDDIKALKSGLTPADVLLPQTSVAIEKL